MELDLSTLIKNKAQAVKQELQQFSDFEDFNRQTTIQYNNQHISPLDYLSKAQEPFFLDHYSTFSRRCNFLLYTAQLRQ
jgi:hypothetical protein